MKPKNLKKLLENKEVLLIDVRERTEYDLQRIEGSVLIPLNTITLEEVKLLNTENKKIVIHCKSGGRSLRACQMLMEYNSELDVYNLEGGITAWSALEEEKDRQYSINGGGCASSGCNS